MPSESHRNVRVEARLEFPQKERNVFRLLIFGFGLITILLGLDGWVGYRGATSVRSSVAGLAENQLVTAPLINEIQRIQLLLSTIEYRIPAVNPTPITELTTEWNNAEKSFRDVYSKISPTDPQMATWREVETEFNAAAAGIDGFLSETAKAPPLEKLIEIQGRLSSITAGLLKAGLARAEANRQQVERATQQQTLEDRLLLIACLFVACLFLRVAVQIYRRMSEQEKELSQVSWQLLEKQESLARRLSRDLHDELGQTLTALKTNFSRHAASSCVDSEWMQDCTELLKTSIRDAHEISQLLRPTLLDDFGLDAALAWLCEKFEERNRISVSYVSDIGMRLEQQTETHLFRIAQEALTNIAKHANASRVRVIFAREPNGARLEISDNGIGLSRVEHKSWDSLGLIGMRARARSIRGEMHVHSTAGRGTSIEVTFPLQEPTNEEANSHLVS